MGKPSPISTGAWVGICVGSALAFAAMVGGIVWNNTIHYCDNVVVPAKVKDKQEELEKWKAKKDPDKRFESISVTRKNILRRTKLVTNTPHLLFNSKVTLELLNIRPKCAYVDLRVPKADNPLVADFIDVGSKRIFMFDERTFLLDLIEIDPKKECAYISIDEYIIFVAPKK